MSTSSGSSAHRQRSTRTRTGPTNTSTTTSPPTTNASTRTNTSAGHNTHPATATRGAGGRDSTLSASSERNPLQSSCFPLPTLEATTLRSVGSPTRTIFRLADTPDLALIRSEC